MLTPFAARTFLYWKFFNEKVSTIGWQNLRPHVLRKLVTESLNCSLIVEESSVSRKKKTLKIVENKKNRLFCRR